MKQSNELTSVSLAVLVVAIILLFFIPFVGSSFYTYLFIEIFIMALFAVAYNFLFGYTGLLSFGHAAYFSIGAYTSALFMMKVIPSLPLAIMAGVILSMLASTVIGYLCVRLDEIYFAMLTLAFGQMFYTIYWKWDTLTGGSDGLVNIPRPDIHIGFISIGTSSITGYYYFTLIIVLFSVLVIWRIVNSPFGLTIKSIRESPERAEFIGIPVKRYRLISFVISGTFSGLAGSLFSPFERSITPEISLWTKSAEPVIMTLLGGMKSFFGPVIGSIIYIILKELISTKTEYWMLYLGILLIFIVIFFREGIVSSIKKVVNIRGI